MAPSLTIAAILAATIVGSTALDFCPVRCYCGETAVYCDDGSARHPPEGLWRQCETLTLNNNNNISSLDIYSLTGFPDLEDISLADNALTALDLRVFAVAPKLRNIGVANNRIDAILPPPQGEQLPNLRHLQLQDTLLSSIDTHLLQSAAPSLEALSIDDTPLACECLYQDLYLWATQRGVQLHHSCGGVSSCPFLPQQRCPFECSCQGEDMYCDDVAMYHPPVGFWPEYERLHISGNRIRALYDYTLTGFPNLTWVDLGRNRLNTLDLGAFAVLSRLEYLSVHNNSVDSVVGPRDGVGLPALQTLILSATSITSLDINILNNSTPLLKSLSLDDTPLACRCSYSDIKLWAQEHNVALSASCDGEDDCSLVSCPDGCNCEGDTAYCGNANLNEFPNGSWPQYRYLLIEDNNIGSVSKESLNSFPNVVQINIQNNRLTVLDLAAFSVLQYLQMLDVSYNKIQSILGPSNGEYLQSLHTLNVTDNDISYIDTSVLESATPRLQTLDIQDTPLACDCAYEELYQWSEEKGVALSADCNGDNQCFVLPCPDGCSCKDDIVDCRNANLNQFPAGNWSHYRYLLIDDNNIATVSKESLNSFPNVVHINFGNNRLTVLDLAAFSVLQYLQMLDVSYNIIQSILAPSNGEYLQSLHTLNVTDNDISYINISVLESAIPRLQTLDIQDTPLACDCAYEELYQWSEEKGVALSADCNGDNQCFVLPCPDGCSCEDDTVYCRNANLNEFPTGNWPQYSYLLIDDNNIGSVSKESLNSFPNVVRINIQNNTLAVLDLAAFSVLQYLEMLDVSLNKIQSISAPSNGEYLQSLHTLNVTDNDISYINISVLESAIPRLQTLDIQDTPLACECAYEELYQWSEEKGVALSADCNGDNQCSIVLCPDGCSCEDDTVYCRNASLNEFPTGNWPQCRYLFIDGNNITSVSKESLNSFPNVVQINIRNNLLTHLDLDAFSVLQYLEMLDVSYNIIESILPPSDGDYLQSLHTLNMTNNGISYINASVLESALPHLQTLDIDDTALACKGSFEELTKWSQEKGVALSANCNDGNHASSLPVPMGAPVMAILFILAMPILTNSLLGTGLSTVLC